jgi:hypothetical protein
MSAFLWTMVILHLFALGSTLATFNKADDPRPPKDAGTVLIEIALTAFIAGWGIYLLATK